MIFPLRHCNFSDRSHRGDWWSVELSSPRVQSVRRQKKSARSPAARPIPVFRFWNPASCNGRQANSVPAVVQRKTEGCGRQTAYLFMALETIREALHHAHQGGRLPCSLFGLNWVEEATKRCVGPTRLRLALWAELLQRKARQWSVAHARTRTRVVVKGRLPNYVPVCAAGPK